MADEREFSSKMEQHGYNQGFVITFLLIGLICFIISWIYAISIWGFFLGVAFGWIPAALCAIIIGVIAGAFWPLLLLLLVILIFYAISQM